MTIFVELLLLRVPNPGQGFLMDMGLGVGRPVRAYGEVLAVGWEGHHSSYMTVTCAKRAVEYTTSNHTLNVIIKVTPSCGLCVCRGGRAL